ncbi:MAG: hypothetical protein JW956_14100 [Calditrichaceae bacterium]|nr:hypothetical protein [Calditrichaceae bacterium]
MIEVIEIPVFVTDSSFNEKYFGAYPQLSLTGYKNCQYITLELNKNSMIILYLMEIQDSQITTAICDRIIPLAPFCMMLLDGETFVINNFHEIYKERYETPLVCIHPKKGSDFDLTYVKNVVIQNNKNVLIDFDPDNTQLLQQILPGALKHTLEL